VLGVAEVEAGLVEAEGGAIGLGETMGPKGLPVGDVHELGVGDRAEGGAVARSDGLAVDRGRLLGWETRRSDMEG
jgi:hypothetical protein